VPRLQLALALLLACLLLGATHAAAEITIHAPPSLAGTVERINRLDLAQLEDALARAGLPLPPEIDVTLVPDDDPRARQIPSWIVGFATGPRDVVIFPDRVVSYPYDSLESVIRHEITHLALTRQAGGRPLPRWFHEGVAVSVDAGWGFTAQLRLLGAMLEGAETARLGQLFASDAESEARQAYLLSAVLIEDIRRRSGADTPGAIAARVASGVPFQRAFQMETGETPDAAAARAWEAYRRWTAWIPAITSASAMWTLILLLAFAAYAVQLRRRAQRRRAWDDDDFA